MTALTAFLDKTATTTLTTADNIDSTAPAAEASVAATGQLAKSGTGWIEIPSQGGSSTTLAGSEPAPSGNGWLWDVTTLEANEFVAGNWTPTVKLSCVGGTFTVDIHVRIYKRSSGGVYTQFKQSGVAHDLLLSAQSIGTTGTAYVFSAASLDLTQFSTGDKLYIDLILNITTGNSNNTASNRVINVFRAGGTSEQVVTPGYQAFSNVTVTGVTAAMTLAAPAGTTAWGFVVAGPTSAVTLAASAGTVGIAVPGPTSALTLAAPAGTVTLSIPGPTSAVTLAAPAGTVTGTAVVAGQTAGLALAAPAGTVTIVATQKPIIVPDATTVIWEIPESLNQLAGTTGLDAPSAANVWAGTKGLDLIDALNAKNGTKAVGKTEEAFNEVCNALAGTKGKDAQSALSKLAGGKG